MACSISLKGLPTPSRALSTYSVARASDSATGAVAGRRSSESANSSPAATCDTTPCRAVCHTQATAPRRTTITVAASLRLWEKGFAMVRAVVRND